MSRYRFPSLFTLLLVSFSLVLLPLLLALGSALYSLEQLTSYSQAAVYRSVRMTHGSRVLLEHLVAMERSAKQYLILGDPALFEHYLGTRETFVAEIQGLQRVVQTARLNRLLAKLEGYEFDLYAILLDPRIEQQIRVAETEQFPYLRQLANQIWQLSIQSVGENLEELEKHSQQAQRQTIRHLTVLLPVAVLLLVFFVFLIIRPIRQLDGAIRKLGNRDFAQPINVSGPRDLEVLGRRLDWLRTRLHMLEAEKQRFMRNISHELKTPLANIHEGIELLNDRVVGELTPEQAEIVQIISDSAGRLYRMIEDLIRYSQLQRIDEAMRPQTVNLAFLVDDVIEDYRVRLRSKALHLQCRLDPIEIRGFPELLRSMIDNLLSNAVKYSPRGGKIIVALFQKAGMMYFEVRDQGPGILPEERRRVFDALYQGTIGRRLGIEGTGLGLAIVSECVVMHHGQVEILDPPQGWGGYFRVSIPFDGIQN